MNNLLTRHIMILFFNMNPLKYDLLTKLFFMFSFNLNYNIIFIILFLLASCSHI